jgi:hypothetical protein
VRTSNDTAGRRRGQDAAEFTAFSSIASLEHGGILILTSGRFRFKDFLTIDTELMIAVFII